MAPTKKSAKLKRKLEDSKARNKSTSNSESNPPDTDWWNGFWHKNSNSALVPENEEEGFKYFFRFSKSTFDYVCSLVREDLISRPPSGLINIEGRLLSVEKQVAIALRRLASGDSQVSVGSSFGVGQSTVSQVTWRFIESMEARARHHLKWPEPNRMEKIRSKFETLFGLSNCCGAISFTHIIMNLPSAETYSDWCDEEKNHTMLLQGVVDDEMRFLDIITGFPGSMPISCMLKFSSFFELCERGLRLNGGNKMTKDGSEIREFIVGNTSYPLLPWLITPYQDKNLSFSMSSFNDKHKNARLLSEKAFSHLKGAWRILSKAMWRPDKHKLPSVILVCCLLHNIIIDNGDELLSEVPLSDHHDVGYKEQCCLEVDPRGQALRQNLAKQ